MTTMERGNTQSAQGGPYGPTLRRLHLAMALFVTVLAITGLVFDYRKLLGIEHLKLTISFIHAAIGYGFIVAFALRIYYGLAGAEPLRFRHVLPRGSDLKRLFAAKEARERFKFAGRSPLSRTIAGLLFLLLSVNILSGMIRAGTDLYFPPVGPIVQAFIVKDGADPSMIKPGEGEYIDESRYKVVKKAKKPFGSIHYYGGLLIIGVALFHMMGVISREWSAPNDPKARGRARLMLFGPKKRR
jgi:cytochrome b